MSTQSTGNSEETRLIFESVVPAVTGEENDNDTLFITDDGTETGNILEMWKFDIETQTWYKIPNPICETLDYTIIDDTRPISRVGANAGLRIKGESNITLTPSNVVGASVTTDQAFFETPNGDKIPLKVTVERRTTGGGSIFIGANGGMSNTPGSADYQITVEILPDCFGNTFDGALMSIIPTSVGGGEALLFSQPYPIEEYIRGPGAPALTLPYVGFWNNNNNNNTSALGFGVSDVISFRANGQNRISSNISVWLRTIPGYKEYDVCQILDFSKDYTDRAIENIQDQDTFGTVTQATANLTTTNEVDITPDNFYIAFPDGTTWASPKCPEEMTRAQLIALRNAGNLSKDCHYVITDPEPNGTLLLEKVLIHAVDESTLSGCYLKTAHDNIAWNGTYDIDTNDVLEVTDNLENKVISNASIINFPFGIPAVNGNTVMNRANVIYTTGNFINNVVETDATVTINSGNVARNTFSALSNTTITNSDFRNNTVQSDATVNTTTTGDVDGNTFGNLSLSNISGTSNIDNSEIGTDANITVTSGSVVNSKFEQLSNYVMSGGILRESTVGQDADVTIISGDNYENVWGNSTIYRQVGTGYIRYSTIEGTTTWINGNTNVSNVNSYVSTVNTTGSTGTISNSTLHRAIASNMQNIPSLTITDSTISNYGQVSASNATRLYIYRSTVTDGARILVSNGSRLDMSYTNLDSYSYIQSTGNGGVTYANYCNLSSYGYMRNLTTNTNRFERCTVTAQSNMRFDGDASNGRIYYSQASGGATIYQTTGSVGCYMYYVTASSLAQVYSQNAVNLRMYYSNATSYSYLRSINNPATHYMYYCNADARGFVQALNNTGTIRMYAVNANSQSIAEMRGSTGNLYYSNFNAYYYAYITRTSGTSLGLFGQGRRTNTVTNPTLQGIGNLNNQTYIDNF